MFSDKDDNLSALVERLESDIKSHNYTPHNIYLTGKESTTAGYCENPWDGEIILYANKLSEQGIERAVLIARTDNVPKSNEEMLLREMIRHIDYYHEKAGENRRYPLIFATSQDYFQHLYNNDEASMTNWGGFRGRLTASNVLDSSKLV